MSIDKRSFMAGYLAGVELRRHRPIPVEPVSDSFLTFSSPNPFTLAVYNSTKNWDGTLEWSTNARNWSEWDGTTTLASMAGNRLYLRGSGNTRISGARGSNAGWILTGNNISCEGDIRSLLEYSDPDHSVMGPYAFQYLFYQNASLIKAPNLPATTLSSDCYYAMFSGCTTLKSAPELPAATMVGICYQRMFKGCTALTEPPALPATNLTVSCYYEMFSGCTSLKSAPKLPAVTLANSCYRNMFSDCTSLESIPALPARNVGYYSYREMFSGCTSLKLSTTRIGEYQTPYRIPRSGTGSISSGALTDMFSGTGGTFTGTPNINTTYYTANEVV